MKKPKSDMCFVLMPFSMEFKNQWELAFVPAIKESGLNPWRGDEEELGTNIIIRDITRCIDDAVLIIADLSGRNPNVMYELGLAHSAKKPVIMLTQDEHDMPFDIRHIRYLKYDKRDLNSLKTDLIERIGSTLSMSKSDIPDFFPELKLLSKEQYEELIYLREKVINLEINLIPSHGDIFFNDRYLGPPPQYVNVNINAARNTISACAIEHYEFHRKIEKEDIEKGVISIKLKALSYPGGEYNKADLYKDVPNWLRNRRKDPNNPVLCRAIGAFLYFTEQINESLEEIEELLVLAPTWYMSHNLAGYIKLDIKPEEAHDHFIKVITLNPNHCCGFFNLAWYFCKQGDFSNTLHYLNKILEHPDRIKSFFTIADDLKWNSRFMAIEKDKKFSQKFSDLNNTFVKERKKYKTPKKIDP